MLFKKLFLTTGTLYSFLFTPCLDNTLFYVKNSFLVLPKSIFIEYFWNRNSILFFFFSFILIYLRNFFFFSFCVCFTKKNSHFFSHASLYTFTTFLISDAINKESPHSLYYLKWFQFSYQLVVGFKKLPGVN